MAKRKAPPLHKQYGISVIDLSFIQIYIGNNFNGTRAYLELHPKVKDTTAASEASDILRKPKVQAAYKAELKFHIQYTGMKAQHVINELVGIANSDILDYIEEDEDGDIVLKPIDKMSIHSKCIKSVTLTPMSVQIGEFDFVVKQKINLVLHDKMKALALVGEHLGVFTNSQNNDQQTTEYDIMDGLHDDS